MTAPIFPMVSTTAFVVALQYEMDFSGHEHILDNYVMKPYELCLCFRKQKQYSVLYISLGLKTIFNDNKCGHRNVLSKRQVWMSIFHIINLKKKIHGHRGPGFFSIKN